eukprot:862787_1
MFSGDMLLNPQIFGATKRSKNKRTHIIHKKTTTIHGAKISHTSKSKGHHYTPSKKYAKPSNAIMNNNRILKAPVPFIPNKRNKKPINNTDTYTKNLNELKDNNINNNKEKK